MPTYAYACADCDHRFDIVQSFSDDSLTVCPSCDGRLRKIFNAVGVVFKGSGFYRTDSRSASSATTPAANSGSKSASSAAASSSSSSPDSSSSSSAPATSSSTSSSSSTGKGAPTPASTAKS